MEHRGVKKLVAVALTALLLAGMATVNAGSSTEETYQFMPLITEGAGACADFSTQILDAPAGKHGFVTTKNGNFVLTETGERIRFWGINMVFSANFPKSQEKANALAAEFASMGINLVRLHGFDSSNGERHSIFKDYSKNTIEFNADQLDKLDYFIYALKQQGIYVNLNLNSKRIYASGDGLSDPAQVGTATSLRSTQLFDGRMIELQKDFAQKLMTHVNPYTRLPYAQEPAIAMIEVINETSLFSAWADKVLDEKLPAYYKAELQELWNQWLAEKYLTNEAMLAAWGLSVGTATTNQIGNNSFEENDLELCKTRTSNKAKVTLSRDDSFSTNGRYSLKANVSNAGSRLDDAVVYITGITLQKGQKYSISIDSKASRSWPVEVSVRQSTYPYTSYGGTATTTVSTKAKTYAYEFTATKSGTNLALAIKVGKTKGNIWFDNIYLTQVGGGTTVPAASLGTVELVLRNNLASFSSQATLDFSEFLLDTERSFYNEIYRYLREDLSAQQPISGNNKYAGVGETASQADMDYTNAHAYYDHPGFPSGWSYDNFTMHNRSLVMFGASSDIPYHHNPFAVMSLNAMEGKPHVVSEWGYPFPNEYEYEAPILMAAVASLQDWDAMILFAYSHSDSDGNGAIADWFDIKNNPAKKAQMGAAALLFTRGDLAPAEKKAVLNYEKNSMLNDGLLGVYSYNLVNGETISPTIIYDTILRYGQLEGNASSSLASMGVKAQTGNCIALDNGSFVWDVSVDGNEYVAIDTSRTQSLIGFIFGREVSTTHMSATLNTGSALTLTSKDGAEIPLSEQLLLTVAGQQQNEGQVASASGGLDNWGAGAVNLQCIYGTVRIEVEEAASYSVYPLNADGSRSEMLMVEEDESGGIRFELTGQTPWYEIVKDGQRGLDRALILEDVVVNLNVGDKYTITASYEDGTVPTDLQWDLNETGDGPAVILLGKNGEIEALAPGSAELSVYSAASPQNVVICTVSVSDVEVPGASDNSEAEVSLYESGHVVQSISIDAIQVENSYLTIPHLGADPNSKGIGLKGSTVRQIEATYGKRPIRLVGQSVYANFPIDSSKYETLAKSVGANFDDIEIIMTARRTDHNTRADELLPSINNNVIRTSNTIQFTLEARLADGNVVDISKYVSCEVGIALPDGYTQHNSWLLCFDGGTMQGSIVSSSYVQVNGRYSLQAKLSPGQTYVTAGVKMDSVIIPDITTPLEDRKNVIELTGIDITERIGITKVLDIITICLAGLGLVVMAVVTVVTTKKRRQTNKVDQ